VSERNWTIAQTTYNATGSSHNYRFNITNALTKAHTNGSDAANDNVPTYFFQFKLEITVNDVLQIATSNSYTVIMDANLTSVKEINVVFEDL
jgi:hypothetical protein